MPALGRSCPSPEGHQLLRYGPPVPIPGVSQLQAHGQPQQGQDDRAAAPGRSSCVEVGLQTLGRELAEAAEP
jgi:hypothetical protein